MTEDVKNTRKAIREKISADIEFSTPSPLDEGYDEYMSAIDDLFFHINELRNQCNATNALLERILSNI